MHMYTRPACGAARSGCALQDFELIVVDDLVARRDVVLKLSRTYGLLNKLTVVAERAFF